MLRATRVEVEVEGNPDDSVFIFIFSFNCRVIHLFKSIATPCGIIDNLKGVFAVASEATKAESAVNPGLPPRRRA